MIGIFGKDYKAGAVLSMEGPFVRARERVWIGFRGEANRVCVVRRQRGEEVAGVDRTNREWEFR